MESLSILAFLFVIVLTIAITRKYVLPSTQENEGDICKLRESLIHGGHGYIGKLTGRVELEVGGQNNGSAAVCISRDLSVMHWWRATGENGTNLLGNCIDSGEVTARSIVAALRLWGKNWEKAEIVIINSSLVTSFKMKNFVSEQIEDSQNKFGVRIIWNQDDNYFNTDLLTNNRGGQELVQQLVRGDGAGQDNQGLHNINLRMNSYLLLLTLCFSGVQMNKAIIRYLGTNFILPHGCDIDDPITQRFYELCMKTYESETMCVSDRLPNGGIITIPRYTNICSAICQGVPESEIQRCPHRGRMVQELDNEGNLLQNAESISNRLDDVRARAKDGFALLG